LATFLSPPVRHQKRRRSGGELVGQSKRKKKREGGTFIRVCPATTTMEKAMRTPAALAMATTIGERWCTPDRPSEHNRL